MDEARRRVVVFSMFYVNSNEESFEIRVRNFPKLTGWYHHFNSENLEGASAIVLPVGSRFRFHLAGY